MFPGTQIPFPTALKWKKEDGNNFELDEGLARTVYLYSIFSFLQHPERFSLWIEPDMGKIKPLSPIEPKRLMRRAEIALMAILKNRLSTGLIKERDKPKAIAVINKVRAFYGKL